MDNNQNPKNLDNIVKKIINSFKEGKITRIMIEKKEKIKEYKIELYDLKNRIIDEYYLPDNYILDLYRLL